MPQSSDQHSVLGELGRIDLGEGDLPQVLSRVAELARTAIPGADHVSVTLLDDSGPGTAAYLGEVAVYLDERQYERRRGPCLDAAESGDVVVIDDMATEDRWPDYTPYAVAQGIRSSLSMGLPRGSVSGALNLYGRGVRAFDAQARELAGSFADYAAVPLANARLYHNATTLSRQLEEAMNSRAGIEQAKGILMALHGCSPQEAFEMLSRESQQTNRKLRDVAADLLRKVRI
jgi:GAF domain-containing protein